MKSLILLVALFVYAQGYLYPRFPMLDGKIVGGTPIQINNAPYQVALLVDHGMISSYTHVCGGAIISKSVILTAAHCTDGTVASQWNVRAGSTFHNSGGQVVPVSKYTQHSAFNSQSDYDISLIFLTIQLSLGNTVATITLPAQGQSVLDGANATVTGWGSLESGGPYPTQLYRAYVPIVNQQTCIQSYDNFNPVTPRMICAGRLTTGGVDSCDGDSGGPMVVGFVLHGITSWGRGCAQPNSPGVYTRVSIFRTWIQSNM